MLYMRSPALLIVEDDCPTRRICLTILVKTLDYTAPYNVYTLIFSLLDSLTTVFQSRVVSFESDSLFSPIALRFLNVLKEI